MTAAAEALTPAQVRHRVIGAIVVLSLLMILVPWFLDPEDAAFDPRQVAIEEIPTNPFVGSPQAPMAMPSGSVQAIQQANQALAGAIVASPEPTVEAPVARPTGTWQLQVASFKNEANAKTLTKRMQDAGWEGVSNQLRKGLHRVTVGPVRERADADRLLDQLKQEFNLKGAVVRVSTP